MRRITAALFMALVLAVAMPSNARAEVLPSDVVAGETADERGLGEASLPDIEAPHACVVTSDGRFLFERAADEPVKIASLTKLMTALVALDNAPLDATVTVDDEAASIGESTSGLLAGDSMTLDTALRALLIPSGNDAAMAIARSVGSLIDPDAEDPLAAFVGAMNDKAAELGMDDTLFTNPHGLDFDAWSGDLHSTAHDVALMLVAAMEDDTVRSIVSGGGTTITVTDAAGAPRSIELVDTNLLLGQDGNIGTKTGKTDEAGTCFAGSWSRDGVEVYTVVLGSDSDEGRFTDSKTLADWAYAHLVQTALAPTSETLADGGPLVAEAVAADWSDKTIDATIADPAATVTVFDLAGPVTRTVDLDEVHGDVEEGDAVGTLSITQEGVEIASVDVVSAESVAAPNPLETVMVAFDRVVRWITGRPATAAAEVYVS